MLTWGGKETTSKVTTKTKNLKPSKLKKRSTDDGWWAQFWTLMNFWFHFTKFFLFFSETCVSYLTEANPWDEPNKRHTFDTAPTWQCTAPSCRLLCAAPMDHQHAHLGCVCICSLCKLISLPITHCNETRPRTGSSAFHYISYLPADR